MTGQLDIVAWIADRLRLDVPAWLGGVPAGVPASSTRTRSWLGLAGAVTVAARGGLLPDLSAAVMLGRIVDEQQPNGVMGVDGTPNGHFLLPELAQGILWAGPDTPPEQLLRWRTALVRGATVLRHGVPGAAGAESTYWTNGNVEVLEATVYYLTWLVTANPVWRDAYDHQVQFIFTPGGSAAGQGMVTVQPPADPDGDWRDARIYITENSGYSPDYAQLQATFLARLYRWSRDVRVLRLLHGVLGQMLHTLDLATMRYDGGGTRRVSGAGGTARTPTVPLHTPAVPLLVWAGLRPDLEPLVVPAYELVLRAAFPPAAAGLTEWHIRSYSDVLAGWLLAAPASPQRHPAL